SSRRLVAERARRIRDQRQDDLERRPAAENALEADHPTVVLDDLVREGKAEARSAVARGVEGIEDAVGIRRLDSDAGVLDLDLHPVRGPPTGGAHRIARAGPAGPYRQPAAARHRVERIGDQVDEDTVERVLVRLDRRHVPRVLAHDLDVLLVELLDVELERALEKLREPHEGEAHPRRPRQLEEPLDDPVDPLQLARDDVSEALAKVRVVDLPVQMPAEGEERGQWILDLVGEA